MAKKEVFEGYCMKCKKMSDMKNVKEGTATTGVTFRNGLCTTCDTKICKIGGTAKGAKKPEVKAKAKPKDDKKTLKDEMKEIAKEEA